MFAVCILTFLFAPMNPLDNNLIMRELAISLQCGRKIKHIIDLKEYKKEHVFKRNPSASFSNCEDPKSKVKMRSSVLNMQLAENITIEKDDS